MKKHLPNFITCLNLFSGCIGVYFAFKNQIDVVTYCIIASGVFDFFDGMVARLLHVKSNIGKELDSLADMVSFGFLPGVIMFMLLQSVFGVGSLWCFAGFVVPVFSALRLAKFNIDTRQTTDFIGLNTPMNTFYVLSLPYIAQHFGNIIYSPYFLLGSIALTSYLLISELRLFSMKFSSLNWQINKYRFLFLLASILLFVFLQFNAVPLILILYFGFSYLHFKAQDKTIIL